MQTYNIEFRIGQIKTQPDVVCYWYMRGYIQPFNCITYNIHLTDKIQPEKTNRR